MFREVDRAFGEFMCRWFHSLTPTTPQMREYCSRPTDKAIKFAPSRMVDSVEEMFSKYLRAKADGTGVTHPHDLPIVFLATARDVTPTGRDFTRQIADGDWYQFPDDERKRIFKVRTIATDIRAQVAILAEQAETAKSMMAQLVLFLDRTESRRFSAVYTFGDCASEWPVQLDSPEIFAAQTVMTDTKNLCCLAADLTLKAMIPLFEAPQTEEDADETTGIAGDPYEPAGFKLVQDANVEQQEAKP